MKTRLLVNLVLLSVATLACALSTPSAPASPAASDGTPPIPPEFVPTAFPITPTFAGCSYVWASKDLPTLSSTFNAGLQAISMDAGGLAYAYGENCVYADGTATFSAMETDFRVGIKVKTVRDEAAMGDWIYKVMQLILGLPAGQIEGPQPGRVDFDFKQPDPAEVMVTVPIDRYKAEAQGLRGIALFQLFHTNP